MTDFLLLREHLDAVIGADFPWAFYREHQTHPFSPINGEENDFSIIDLVKIMELCEDGRDSLNNGRVMKRKGKIEEQKWRECENITRTKTICGASFLSLEF